MRTFEWREYVRLAALRAAKSPRINRKGLASEVDWSPQSFAKFLNNGMGGEDKIEMLEEKLIEYGFLEKAFKDIGRARENIPPIGEDGLRVVAKKLQYVLDVIKSPACGLEHKVSEAFSIYGTLDDVIEVEKEKLHKKEKKKP